MLSTQFILVVLAVQADLRKDTANCDTKVPLGTRVRGTQMVDLARSALSKSRAVRIFNAFNVQIFIFLNLA